jgi:site-specific recombinase XerD
MEPIDIIIRYKRFLKRVNYSEKTIRNYLYTSKKFISWLDVPVEKVKSEIVFEYLGFLHNKRLKPRTINSYLNAISRFYKYLYYEEKIKIKNPVKPTYMQILPKPLPRFLRTEEIDKLFHFIKGKRDVAMFILMLRSGLRVEEVASLTLRAIDFKRKMIVVFNGKFRKDRIVYFSEDTNNALQDYLKTRKSSRAKRIFLVQKGLYKGRPISIRGIQKRIEYYAIKTGINVSCHSLRHTMATQLINANAMLVTVQELLGHNCIQSTQRYAKISKAKVRKDYFEAMDIVMEQQKII